MIQQRPFLLLASAAVLSLALGQATAGEAAPAAAPAQPAPTPEQQAPAQAAPAESPEASIEAMHAEMKKRYEEMQQRWEEAMAERKARYEEMRKRATEAGMEMPEMPPWERGGPMGGPGMMPPMGPGMMGPGMAGGESGNGEPGAEAPQQPMSPEEAKAMREKRWEEMRSRAAEQGVELPETPPWEAAEQRRKEMLDAYKRYRSVIEAMSDEQKEAISALFGGGTGRFGCRQPMGPRGGYYPGYGMGPGGWGQPPQGPEMPEMPGSSQAPEAPAAQ